MAMVLTTEIMDALFVRSNNADRVQTRSSVTNDFVLPQVNTVHYGHDSLRFLGCKIWGLIPEEAWHRVEASGVRTLCEPHI